MYDITVLTTPSWSQTGGNHTMAQIYAYVARHAGGASDQDRLLRAEEAVRAAILRYNMTYWKFNRKQKDITLVGGTAEYTLDSNFYMPASPGAKLLDASNRERDIIEYIEFEDYTKAMFDESETSTLVWYYTVRNVHANGIVRFIPTPGTTLTYPKARINYLSRIVVPTSTDDKLDVPQEVEQGILDLAVAEYIKGLRGGASATIEYSLAQNVLEALKTIHQDWPDLPVK